MPFHEKAYGEDDVEAARKVADQIHQRARAGMSPSAIASSFKPRLKTGAVKRILAEDPVEQPGPGAEPDPAPAVEAPAPPPPPTEYYGRRIDPAKVHAYGAAALPRDVSHLPRDLRGDLQPDEVAPPAPPPEPPRMRPPPMALTAPDGLRRELGYSEPGYQWSTTPPAEGATAPSTSPFAGPYSSGSVYDVLFSILREHSVPEAQSRGIVRRFSHLKGNDFNGLETILSQFGIREGFRASIVQAYRAECADPSESSSDPLAAIGSDPLSSPLAAFDAESDRAWLRDVRRRAIEADLKLRERRAAGLDNPSATAPAASSADSETVRLLREELAKRDRELLETRHESQMKGLESRLSAEIEALRKGQQAPSSSETQLKAQADLSRALTTQIEKRSDEVGALAKTAREAVIRNPRLLAKLEHSIERTLDDLHPEDALQPGDRVQQPTLDEIRQATDELSRGADPIPADSSAGLSKIRRIVPLGEGAVEPAPQESSYRTG